ncbi:MAG: hypothetical protein KDI13_01885 [Alphaproteobacteria bacterium]|nr:hypothetical protein [Alphaproteobacteria bacterium]
MNELKSNGGMKKYKKGAAGLLLLACFVGALPATAQAQRITNPYKAPQDLDQLDQQDVPRIFSARLAGDEAAAAKLDRVYYNLNLTLRDYAQVDTIHQKNLMELMQPFHFKLSRYGAEFRRELKQGMDDLNKNYKSMQNDLKTADEAYGVVIRGFSEENQKTVEALWKSQRQVFVDRSNKYFGLQSKFLNTYKSLVHFLIDQGGNYYYDQETQKVAFYDVGAYTYFGKTLENLIQIGRDQRQILSDSTYSFVNDDDAPALP